MTARCRFRLAAPSIATALLLAGCAGADGLVAGPPDVVDAAVVTDAVVPATAPDVSADAEVPDTSPEATTDADADVPDTSPDAATDADADVPDTSPDAATDADAEVPDTSPGATTDADAEVPDASPDTAADADAAAPDATPAPDAAPVDPKVCPYGLTPKQLGCRLLGPCKEAVAIACQGTKAVCDYSGVASFEPYELSCDGLDNDCNGKVDDELSKPAAKAWPAVGVCLFATQVCKGVAGWLEPLPAEVKGYEAKEASCDGLDNDCDGLTDALAGVVPAAGAGPALGVCAKALQTCVGGAWQLPAPGAIAGFEAKEQSCDGLDNDCDGQTDEALTPPALLPFALLTTGVCANAPPLCSAGAWTPPDYAAFTAELPGATTSTYEPVETRCDGLDNDCDGQTDEALFGPPADKQAGVCAGSTRACYGAIGFGEPNYAALAGYAAGSELSCDALDNDCDGITDEEAACPRWQRGGGGSGRLAATAAGGLAVVAHRAGWALVDTAGGGAWLHRFDHGFAIDDVAIAADGAAVASVGADAVLRVVTTAVGPLGASAKPLLAVDLPGQRWRRVAFDGSGSRLAIGDHAGWVRVWSIALGQQQLALYGHEAPLTAIDWLRAGPEAQQAVVSGDAKGRLRRWSLIDGSGAAWTDAGAALVDLAAAPTATQVLAARADGGVWLHGQADGKALATLTVKAPVALALLPDSGALVALADGSVARLQPIAASAPALVVSATLAPPQALLAGEVAADLALGPGASLLWASAHGPPLRRALPGTPAPVPADAPLIDAARGAVVSLGAFASLGALASGQADGRAWLRRPSDGAPLLALVGHGQPVVSLASRPASAKPAAAGQLAPHLATGGKDGSTRLWSLAGWAAALAGEGVATAQNVKTFGVGLGWPHALAFAADGATLYAGATGSLRAVTSTGAALDLGVVKLVWSLPLTTAAAALDVADNGRVAVGLLGDAVAVRLLDGGSGALLAEAKGLDANRRALRFLPGGGVLAVSGGAARLQLLDGATLQVLAPLPGHVAEVTAIDASADGKRLLSADAAGSARLWQRDGPAKASALAVLTTHCPWPCVGLSLEGVRFVDAAGTHFVTAASDGGLIGWRRP